MTRPLFLAPLGEALPPAGAPYRLDGPEGRHAAIVRRIRPGEELLIGDGRGRGLVCVTVAADKQGLDLEVVQHVNVDLPPLRIIAVQGLAKGERSELAVEMMTEVGVDGIRPWQAARSIVKWQGERGERSRAKWQNTAREAAKQSRRLWVPVVGEILTIRTLTALVAQADLTLVLHEEGVRSLAEADLPTAGTVVVIIGPEGGISPEELAAVEAEGGQVVTLGDGVLRTSTAGVVAVGHLRLRS